MELKQILSTVFLILWVGYVLIKLGEESFMEIVAVGFLSALCVLTLIITGVYVGAMAIGVI